MGDQLLVAVSDPAPADASAYYAGTFREWPQGSPVTIGPGLQGYVCGGWRIVAGHDAAYGPTVTARQFSAVTGGLQLDITATGPGQVTYLRQLVPNLAQLAGETWTPTHRVISDSPLSLDYYARARWNADDAQRLLVSDTDPLELPAGNHVVHTSLLVPQLDDPGAAGWELTDRNALECALRFWSTGAGTTRVVIPEVAMPPGVTPALPAIVTTDDERDAVQAFEQADHYELTGWDDARGQKRAWIDYADKALPIGVGHIRVRDMAGQANRVSTLDRGGVRTDGVVPYAISGAPVAGRRSGFGVILQNSYAAGITFDWYVRNYGEGEWNPW